MGKYAILFLFIFLLSCAGVGRGIIESPRISVEGVRLSKVDLDQQEILIDLKVANPNSFPLPIRGISYKLDINGAEFASGFNSKTIDIPSGANNETTLLITGNLLTFLKKFNRDNLTNPAYRISGDISILSTDLRFPYSHEGRLQIDRYY